MQDRPGAFAELARVIGETGASLGAIDLVRAEAGVKVRDVTVLARDADHIQEVAAAAGQLDGVEVEQVSDRTFLLHLGGKIEVALKAPLVTRDDLSMAYTPGVARVSQAIADDPEKAWSLTIKRNTVAIVSDGTAVLGLGDIGPEAAMPVMEGKAMLLKEFAGVDAWPVCLATKDTDEIVAVGDRDRARLRRDQPRGHLRAALLRDRGAAARDPRHPGLPRRPARHGDRRLRRVRERPARRRQASGGREGRRHRRRRRRRRGDADPPARRRGDDRRLRPAGRRLQRPPGPRRRQGRVRGADQPRAGARVGGRRARAARTSTSACRSRGRCRSTAIRTMAKDAIVFAMANPTPEVAPEELEGLAAVVATGRSDYPNQINNVLAFPGVFRGALDVRARDITEGMKLAAGDAIAGSDRRRRARAGVHRPERLQPRGRACRRRGGGRSGGARRRRAPPPRPRDV